MTAASGADLNYEQAHLVKMINQIAANVPDRHAVPEQVAAHVRNFWTPQMRVELEAIARDYPEALVPEVHTALDSLRRH